jgi:hypothetical protein
MGTCSSALQYEKNGDSLTNGNRDSGSDAPIHPPKTNKGGKAKPNHLLSTIGSEIQPIHPNRDHISSQSIILPDDQEFSCSINGRNGWNVEEVYDLGESVRASHAYSYDLS